MAADSEKLDQIIKLLDCEEINALPDSILPMSYDAVQMKIGTNQSMPFSLRWYTGTSGEGHRTLMIQLMDPFGTPLFYRQFKFVFRDEYTGKVYDKPGQYLSDRS